jgi:hypothetical protein
MSARLDRVAAVSTTGRSSPRQVGPRARHHVHRASSPSRSSSSVRRGRGRRPAADPRAATLEVVREALRTRDLSSRGAVRASDVRWSGSSVTGGCRGRDQFLATLREQFDAAPPQLRHARRAGDSLVLEIALAARTSSAGLRWRSTSAGGSGSCRTTATRMIAQIEPEA